ncbi:class I SAM-dependent methyltransferase [Agrococcus sp. ARC_14]|uniref:class I SAM-dependent methyltransferase n=1 Tax=Agrococcus sp. ARC_14 TaxID=2919927 RepID=UPI001F055DAB|nr:class I SAM-dependent methyltransferase [Agrococcus sp. ARC_14]MCH1881684.1 methyltransferase domain-containing protein [Agrococcus sp. ARC_14]
MSGSAADFWEARYADSDRIWSGRVNGVLAEVAGSLAPGRALDLGCGEGGDALWLAQQGWAVTGVDLSPTAIERARAAAAAAGIRPDLVRFEAADPAAWSSSEAHDLVTASFLQSPVELPREEILRRATGFVAPGGRLLVVAHAGPPSWAGPEGMHAAMAHAHTFPAPERDLAALGLDPAVWETLVCETRERAASAPDGSPGTLADSIVLVRRLR